MIRPNLMPSGQDETFATAAKHLPPGVEITAHVQCGGLLVIATEGTDAPLGWFDLTATEPIWLFVPPHSIHGRPYPIKALLNLEGDLVVISDEAIWRYHWPEGGGRPELTQRARIPRVVGRNLVMAVITPNHLALLTNRISESQSTSNNIKAMIKDGGPSRRLTETVLLLDSATFQELGSAVTEQTWDHLVQDKPPHRWRGIELSRGHLVVDQGRLGAAHVSLRKGPVIDLQTQIIGSTINT